MKLTVTVCYMQKTCFHHLHLSRPPHFQCPHRHHRPRLPHRHHRPRLPHHHHRLRSRSQRHTTAVYIFLLMLFFFFFFFSKLYSFFFILFLKVHHFEKENADGTLTLLRLQNRKVRIGKGGEMRVEMEGGEKEKI
jgi:hypothetical protein